MKPLCAAGAIVVLAGASGCSEIARPLPTNVPVMIGPVTQIGGRPTPMKKSRANEAAEFDKDNESSVWVCWASGYPTISVTRPGESAIVDDIGKANAVHAGRVPLKMVTPRLSGLGVGAYMWFAAGCYGQAWWWNADGHAEAP